jgi:hypothetical protein
VQLDVLWWLFGTTTVDGWLSRLQRYDGLEEMRFRAADGYVDPDAQDLAFDQAFALDIVVAVAFTVHGLGPPARVALSGLPR